jgi:hypothetical protein
MAKDDDKAPTVEQLHAQVVELRRIADAQTKQLDTLRDLINARSELQLPSDDQMSEAIRNAMAIISSLSQLAKDALASAPMSPTSSGWRRLHDACAQALGFDGLAEAVPAPRGPQSPTMVPRGETRGAPPPRPAKGGALPAPPTRPDLGGSGGSKLAQPTVQTGAQRQPQTGTAGASDIRNRPDVAAELDRLKNPAKK